MLQKAPYRTAGFVLELDPTGTKLLFATYLAGQQRPGLSCSACYYATTATALAIDESGNVYVGGSTNEADYPTTPGAFMTKPNPIGASPFGDTFFYSFVTKISPAGKLVYSTFLGSGPGDCGLGGSACIGHESTSQDIESLAVNGAGQVTASGVGGGGYSLGSGYVARLAANGSSLLWSHPVGANYPGVGCLYLAQQSDGSLDLFGCYVTAILTPGLPAEAGTPGLFATRLGSDGATVLYAADFGQSPDSSAAGIALDASGNVFLAGTSSSAQFPTLAGVPNLGADFVMELDPSGAKPRALFRFPRGTVSAPPSFDTSSQLLLLGSGGALLTLPPSYAFGTPAIVGFANAASFAWNTGIAPGELISLIGFDLGAAPGKVQVLIHGLPATVLYAGPNQINVQAPFELGQVYGPSNLEVVLPSERVSVTPVPSGQSLGLFTTDGIHAAALNQDGSVNSASNPAAQGSIVTLFGTGATWPSGIHDGALAAAPLPLDQEQNRFAVIDSYGTPASILYAGAAPGLIYGVFQLNVQLPPDAAPPLTLITSTPTPYMTALSSNAVRIYLK